MPTTEIITIINNSGKVISTGKQLVGIFKEAKAAYREKREHIKLERAERAGIQRAKTFDVTPRGAPDRYYEEDEYDDHVYDRRAIRDAPRRRSQDDLHSQASSHRSHRSRRSDRPDRDRDRSGRPALTIANLQTHSEVSATAPSAAPNGASKTYRAPYAETAPRDMQLSRPNLAHAATMPLPPRSEAPTMTTATPVATARQSMLVHRPRSDPSLKKKEIDMNLAYGDIPPDLAHRADLDHTASRSPRGSGELQLATPPGAVDPNEAQALTMVDRIESLLEEAHCIHHTASSMIANLQQNPQAAAAVALTLAELSTLIGKMSPSFLPVLKGSSPAIFALLASPQFLIGTSVVVGVTVVIFGGWKIVKKIKDNAAAKAMEAPFEMRDLGGDAAKDGAAGGGGGERGEYEEALVLEEELSTIETWRRGITPFGADADEDEETADVELMSPEAERHLREKYRDAEVDPMDSVSQVGARSHRSGRSHRSRRHRHRKHHDGDEEEVDVPERKSSRRYRDKEGGESEVAESVRSHRSSRSHHSSASSKHSSRSRVKAIEEGKEDGEEVVKGKEKKNNMLKTLFKKMKDKEEEKEGRKEGRAMSVMV
ncbi:hypothetical protein QBC34DRAFT_133977 [Podospora aff. communis PSN243]|uniref:Uncharacterized protein n=1 Tax=Podospora aff. communis PSN243 TaxID=3040156 RepID=A0AAV9GH73_9PEZI|nr:hypothetical protein QBC34DRAFT_133977 [Podospora aff. communis PSN243]